jgi:hypothetical protein
MVAGDRYGQPERRVPKIELASGLDSQGGGGFRVYTACEVFDTGSDVLAVLVESLLPQEASQDGASELLLRREPYSGTALMSSAGRRPTTGVGASHSATSQ